MENTCSKEMPVTWLNRFPPNVFDPEPLLSLPDSSPFYCLPFPRNTGILLLRVAGCLLHLLPCICWPQISQSAGAGEGSFFRIALWLFIWILPGPVQDPLFQEAFHPGFSSKRMCPFSKPGWNMLICHWQLLILPGILTFLYVHVLPPSTTFC